MRANLRHYRFLVEGLDDLAAGLRRRRVGLLLRIYPHHRLAPVADELHATTVIGDENPLRRADEWRKPLQLDSLDELCQHIEEIRRQRLRRSLRNIQELSNWETG